MKNKAQSVVILLSMIFFHANLFAQTTDWKTEKTKDGKISVKSHISKRTDEKGKSAQLIEYVATTTANVSMANCISLIKNASKHKEFLDEKETKLIKKISDSEWIIYYYFNSPWPMPDADCVNKMIFSEDEIHKTATFTLTAAPTLYEKKDMDRITYYNVIYQFKDLGNGKVELTMTAKISPVVQAPEWLVRGFFPNGPADMMRKIISLSKGNL